MTNITVKIDGKDFSVSNTDSVFDAITKSGAKIGVQKSFQEKDWIHNGECPLLNIAEINGKLFPVKFLKSKKAVDKMDIKTNSKLIDDALGERIDLLKKGGECLLIRELQEVVAAEAESAGFIDMEERKKWKFDLRYSLPSLLHDPNKCVRCKACIEVCRDVQAVDALSFDEEKGIIIDENKCSRCGQCIHVCPMGFKENVKNFIDWMGCESCAFSRPLGAMREIDDTVKVWNELKNPDRYVVVQFAPAIRASIGEEFGFKTGEVVTGKLYAALRKIGFDKVWDTNFTADLTIMEEGFELINRVKNGGVLPQFTSCSPGWIKYIETFYPTLIPNISSAKSPQQMFGPAAKTYAAEKLKIDPRKMTVVSIMPCTAKKFECKREEMTSAFEYWKEKGTVKDSEKFYDVDIVLTTREAVKLLKMAGVNLADMPDEKADGLLGEYTGAAPIFGRTGGVMEAALRTAYEVLTGKPLENLEFHDLGTLDGIKRATVMVGDIPVKVAVAHGLDNDRKICESIKTGGEFKDYHFIEFMACPGGRVGGGGQPIQTNTEKRIVRAEGVNTDDRNQEKRKSHINSEVKKIYDEFLKEPLSHKAHHLLHTHYVDRSSSIK